MRFTWVEKSYNKTVIDFNFGRHENLSTLKSDIHLGLGGLSLFRVDKSSCHVYLIEVNNCIILYILKHIYANGISHPYPFRMLGLLGDSFHLIEHSVYAHSKNSD